MASGANGPRSVRRSSIDQVQARIPVNVGEQMEIESGCYHHWVLVTNDHTTDAAVLESDHRHKGKGKVRKVLADWDTTEIRSASSRCRFLEGTRSDPGA